MDEPFIGNVLEIVGAFVAPTDPEAEGDIYTIMRVVDFAVSPPAGQDYERSPLGLMAAPMRQTVSLERDRLADWLQRYNYVPNMTTVLTGTAIVPPPEFTLQEEDVVTMSISGIGILENDVVVV